MLTSVHFQRPSVRKVVVLSVAVGLLLLAGCQNMQVQPKLADPYGESATFGRAAREILPEAVPVGFLQDDEHLYQGTNGGELVSTFPFEITEEILMRGREQYEGFCTPCHGYSGYGNGIVALEGFPRPASFHTDDLRSAPVGRLYQAIANGVENMYSYASRVQPEDRWAIVAYIRVMQYSQNANYADLPEAAQTALDAID